MYVAVDPSPSADKLSIISLNKSSQKAQIALSCTPSNHLARAVTSAMVSVGWARRALEESLNLSQLKHFFYGLVEKVDLNFNDLENAIVIVLMDGIRYDLAELSEILIRAEKTVGHFTTMMQTVQLHLTVKKLIHGTLTKAERKEWNMIKDTIEDMPQEFLIPDAIPAKEFRKGILFQEQETSATRTKADLMSQIPNSQAQMKSQDLYLEKEQTEVEVLNDSISLLSDIESNSINPFYLQSMLDWLKCFENLASTLIKSLAFFIGPKVSHSTREAGDGISFSKSFGFTEGISLMLQESFMKLNRTIHQEPAISTEMNETLVDIKIKISLLAEALSKLEKRAKKLDPTLGKLFHAILAKKRKFPQDVSILDEKMAELKDRSDMRTVALSIWKTWSSRNPLELQDQGSTDERIELLWDSSDRQEVILNKSSSDEPVPLSSMNSFSQAKATEAMLDSLQMRIRKVSNKINYIGSDAKSAKRILNMALSKLHHDEKTSFISPATFYVILRHFENYIKTSITSYQAIASNIGVIKAVLSHGRRCLELSVALATNEQTQPIYPLSLQIIISIPAPLDTDAWLRVKPSKEDLIAATTENEVYVDPSEGDGQLENNLIDIKLPSKPQSSSTDLAFAETDEHGHRSTNSDNSSKSTYDEFLPINTKYNIMHPLKTLGPKVSLPLRTSLKILQFPNPCLAEGMEDDYFIGLTTILLNTTLELQLFKEITQPQRENLEEAFMSLETRLDKLTAAPLQDDIANRLNKLSELIGSMERSLSYKLKREDHQESNESEYHNTILHKIDEEESCILPDEIEEQIAAKNGKHTWNAMSGTERGGGVVILKNLKSHESHIFTRLPVLKRIEIIVSLLKYIDQITAIVENNAKSVLEEITEISRGVKNKAKRLTKFIKKEIVSDANVDFILESLRSSRMLCHSCLAWAENIFVTLDYGRNMIKDVHTYVDLKLKLENSGVPEKVPKGYRVAVSNKSLEIEISLRRSQNYPVSVNVPMNFAFLLD
jgi:hypothetical protein